jgi:hypothetical protein
MGRPKLALLAVACVSYGASIASPAFSCGDQAAHGYDILVFGWLGLVRGDPRWLANLLFVAALVRVGTAGDRQIHAAWLVVTFAAVLLAAFSFILPAEVCGDAGAVGPHMGPLIGAFLWTAAMVSVAALVLIQRRVGAQLAP